MRLKVSGDMHLHLQPQKRQTSGRISTSVLSCLMGFLVSVIPTSTQNRKPHNQNQPLTLMNDLQFTLQTTFIDPACELLLNLLFIFLASNLGFVSHAPSTSHVILWPSPILRKILHSTLPPCLVFVFWPFPHHVEVPGPGIKLTPQQQPKLLQ